MMCCGARRGSVGHQARGVWPLMATDQAVRLIGRWMAVQPDMKMRMDGDEAGEAEDEAVGAGDETDVALGARTCRSRVA